MLRREDASDGRIQSGAFQTTVQANDDNINYMISDVPDKISPDLPLYQHFIESPAMEDKVRTTEVCGDKDYFDALEEIELQKNECRDVMIPFDEKIKYFFSLPYLNEEGVSGAIDMRLDNEFVSEVTVLVSPTDTSVLSGSGTPSEETIVLTGDSCTTLFTNDDELCDLSFYKKDDQVLQRASYEYHAEGFEEKNSPEKRADTPFPSVYKLLSLSSGQDSGLEGHPVKNTPRDDDDGPIVVNVCGKKSSGKDVNVPKSDHQIDSIHSLNVGACGIQPEKKKSVTDENFVQYHKSSSIHSILPKCKNKFTKIQKGLCKYLGLSRKDKQVEKEELKTKPASETAKFAPESDTSSKRGSKKWTRLRRFFRRHLKLRDPSLARSEKCVEQTESLRVIPEKGVKKSLSRYFSPFRRKKKYTEPICSEDVKVCRDSNLLSDQRESCNDKSVHREEIRTEKSRDDLANESPPDFHRVEDSKETLANVKNDAGDIDDDEVNERNFPNMFASLFDQNIDSTCLSFVMPFSTPETYSQFQPFIPVAGKSPDFVCSVEPMNIFYSNMPTYPTVNSAFFDPFQRYPNFGFNYADGNRGFDCVVIDGYPGQSFPMVPPPGNNLVQQNMPLGLSENAKNSPSKEDLDETFANNSSTILIDGTCQTSEHFRKEIMSLKEELEMLKKRKKVKSLRNFFGKLKNSTTLSPNRSSIKKREDTDKIFANVCERRGRRCTCEKCEQLQSATSFSISDGHLSSDRCSIYSKETSEVLTKESNSFKEKLSKFFSRIGDSTDRIKPESDIISKKAFKLLKERQKLIEKIELNSLKHHRLQQSEQESFASKFSIRGIQTFFSRPETEKSIALHNDKLESCKVMLKLPFIDEPISAVLLISDEVIKMPNDQKETTKPTIYEEKDLLSRISKKPDDEEENKHSNPKKMLFARGKFSDNIRDNETFFFKQKGNKRLCLMNECPENDLIPRTTLNERDSFDNPSSSFMSNFSSTSRNKEPDVRNKMGKPKNKSKTVRNERHFDENSSGTERVTAVRDNRVNGTRDVARKSVNSGYCGTLPRVGARINDFIPHGACKVHSHVSLRSHSNKNMDLQRCQCCPVTQDEFRPLSSPEWLRHNGHEPPTNFARQINDPSRVRNNRSTRKRKKNEAMDELPGEHLPRYETFYDWTRRMNPICHRCPLRNCEEESRLSNFQNSPYKSGQQQVLTQVDAFSENLTNNDTGDRGCVWFKNCPKHKLSRQKNLFSLSKIGKTLHPRLKAPGRLTGKNKSIINGKPRNSLQCSGMQRAKTDKAFHYSSNDGSVKFPFKRRDHAMYSITCKCQQIANCKHSPSRLK